MGAALLDRCVDEGSHQHFDERVGVPAVDTHQQPGAGGLHRLQPPSHDRRDQPLAIAEVVLHRGVVSLARCDRDLAQGDIGTAIGEHAFAGDQQCVDGHGWRTYP
ncbi:hypothetical protein [Rhodococcus sp. MTM3W5.2]|uniref:hypothetical protein n=1 Tax=Rhodococcus sp. MTM3W5.2 TaxID=1805827 RepID=UPI0011AE5C91|nr:hypothetical protein [Rhodococcus sp. MTM3W5.2]